MAPVAVWAALAVGLELWAAGHALPAQVAFTPYAPEPGSTCRFREYYDQTAQMCCSKCPPGQHAKVFCTKTSDTVCDSCEDSTYTQLWNWVPECLSCGSRCSSDQVETQACTREQNRVCTCRPGWYCALSKQEGCRLCTPLRKCRPGFGVAKSGTETSDVVCKPCTPGTFSNTTSSTDICRPHQICNVVAIPGNASMDAVCTSTSPTRSMAPGAVHLPQPVSTRSQHMQPTPGPSTAPSTSFLLPMGPIGKSQEARLIVGVTALGLLIIGVVNCVIMTQPHLPADKTRGTQGPEQQHLLITAPSSSSSSLESSASALDRRVPTRNQPQAPGVEKASGAGEARASTGSSDSSPGGHGTQVNCSSQASSTMGDTDSSPSESPKDEQVPFSKEECAFRSQLETPETLLGSTEEKPLPLGVPDVGMKPS
uniref:Tumor necrosis factor receptor superfamily member 1B n=1 Tax=Nomascus leucogenys TaxID=61853 RepID=G1RFE5_NOMLE